MSHPTCPECGAPQAPELTCWARLEALLAWEFDDAELRAEHFSIVAAYNLQHPAQFTEAALAGLRADFIERLDQALPVADIRRRVGRAAEGGRRVLRPEAVRRPVRRQWSMTIADAYGDGDPVGAVDRVRTWAAAVRRQL